MASVFKALDRQTNRMVAIKIPPLEFATSARNYSRFAREAAIIAKLDHPGILKIIPVPEKSRPYFVMEYVEGETLWDILQPAHPLPISQALRLGSRICDILDYIHRHGIVHRDLKPGNVMIGSDGGVRIIDFGIASGPAVEAFGFAWFPAAMGTPGYMAPEQIRGDRVDQRTDIYSLGVVLYEAVTGVHPFRGYTDEQILNTRAALKPRPPREFNSSVNEQVEEIVLHAMAPRPGDRFRSALAMKSELDSPETVQVTGLYRNPRGASVWPKRLRFAGFILGVLAIPVLLFFALWWAFQRRLGP
jgi:eukaryotic-like serine/threonine-protein kinase